MIINLHEAVQRDLFEKLCHAVVGHSTADIAGAATNLLLTVVQKRYLRLADAEARWDELMGRGRLTLQRRYGKRPDNAEEHEISQRLVG